MDKATTDKLTRLAEPARVHAELARDSTATRDAAIADAYEAGGTVRELAKATGLSPAHIHRIVVREAARRQILHVE